MNHYLSLNLYRPPPVLIIHLTRFKQVRGAWVKHQSNIEYPLTDLDLSEYVVRKQETAGEADLTYWKLLGGKTQTADRSATNKMAEAYTKQERDWESFEKKLQEYVGEKKRGDL